MNNENSIFPYSGLEDDVNLVEDDTQFIWLAWLRWRDHIMELEQYEHTTIRWVIDVESLTSQLKVTNMAGKTLSTFYLGYLVDRHIAIDYIITWLYSPSVRVPIHILLSRASLVRPGHYEHTISAYLLKSLRYSRTELSRQFEDQACSCC